MLYVNLLKIKGRVRKLSILLKALNTEVERRNLNFTELVNSFMNIQRQVL